MKLRIVLPLGGVLLSCLAWGNTQPKFVLDFASPTLDGNITPDDILVAGPSVHKQGTQLGLQDDLFQGLFDMVTSIAFPSEVPPPSNRGEILFSVDRVSVGLAGTGVNGMAPLGKAAQSVYQSTPGSMQNAVYLDGEVLGLSPGIFGDDLTALDLGDAGPDVYFTLGAFSVSLGTTLRPNDILLSPGDGHFELFKTGVLDIGLDPDDEISSLVLDPIAGTALFSLSPFSPSTFTFTGNDYVAGLGGALSPADILFTDFSGSFSLWASAAEIGLNPDDDLDALAAVPRVDDATSTALLFAVALAALMCGRGCLLNTGRKLISSGALAVLLASSVPSAHAQAIAGRDLETVFLGFNPVHQGSSAQIDFSLPDRLVRFTAWLRHETNRFQDFQIDLEVKVPQSWRRLTSGGSDRVIFTHVDPARNLRLNGNFLLAPFWNGVLDASPMDPSRPMDNMPIPGPVRWLMTRAPLVADAAVPGGARSMPFGVFRSVHAAVSIPSSVLVNTGVRIELDDGFDDTPDSMVVTHFFAASGAEATASSLPFRYGCNRLRFVFPDGAFEAFCMNYDEETPAIVEERVHLGRGRWMDEIDETGNTHRVVRNGFNLVVGEEMPEATTSSFLRINRLRPLGFAPIIGLYNVVLHGLELSGDRDSNGITDLRDFVTSGPARFDPRVGLLHEDFQLEYDALGETVQRSIAVVDPAALVPQVNYVRATRGWGLPAGGAAHALGWAGEHFWMDTFLAQRLVQAWETNLGAGLPENFPVVGVCDSGFNKEGAFPNADMPLSNFWELWSNVGTAAGGQPVLINNQNAQQLGFTRRDPVAQDFQDNKIWDPIDLGGHGTGVGHFVNARGRLQKMGTGLNNYISVIKLVGLDDVGGVDRINVFSWSAYAAAASVAERTPRIRVLNFSNGMGIRTTAAGAAALIAERTQDAELLFDRLARSGIAACVSSRNNTAFFFPLPAVIPPAGLLVPIPGLVAPVRGGRVAATDTYLIRQARVVGAADNFSPLMMRCGGLTLPNTGGTQETIWGPVPPAFGPGAGQGGNVSVSGHADQIHSVKADGSLDFSISGTSFSTPMVSGALGEIIRILDIRAGDAAPTTAAQRSGRAVRVRQAIEIIEATADRVIGSNPAGNFDAPEQAPRDQMGFGRLNLWKACLSAINGGLAAGGISPRVAPLTFASVVDINAANTAFYGFQLRLQSAAVAVAQRFDGATAWLNHNPYDDDFGTAATLGTNLTDAADTTFTGLSGAVSPWPIVAFKRTTSLNSRLADGFNPAGVPPVAAGVTELALSARRQELTPSGAVDFKRLELRRNGQTASDQPFFAIPLNLPRLRNNDTAAPPHNGENVRFDDFVFEILVDHTVAFNLNEVRGIAAGAEALGMDAEIELTATLTDAAGNGVNGVTVDFIVCNNTTGAQDDTTQINLRTARGGGTLARTQNIATAGGGIARVFVTRVAQAAGVQGVVSRIRVRANTVSAGGAAAGGQFPMEFTLPVRP